MSDFINSLEKYFSGMPETKNVDCVIQINESAINSFLEKNFEKDKDDYLINEKIELNISKGSPSVLELGIQIQALSKVEVFLYENDRKLPNMNGIDPFSSVEGWITVDKQKRNVATIIPIYPALSDKNKIKLFCSRVSIHVTWPKNNKPGEYWSWEAKYSIAAEALISNRVIETMSYLEVSPKKVKISVPDDISSDADIGNAQLTDLIALLINLVSSKYAPRLLFNLKMPIFEFKSLIYSTSSVYIVEDKVLVGFSIDKEKTIYNIKNDFNNKINEFNRHYENDIEKMGGMEKLLDDWKINKRKKNAEEYFSEALKETNEYIKKISNETDSLITESDANTNAFVAINLLSMERICSSLLPEPVSKFNEKRFLRHMKGSARYGYSFGKPEFGFSFNHLYGKLPVYAFINLTACIKQVIDCSWSWSCNSIIVRLKNNPHISLLIKNAPNGVVLSGSIGGQLETDVDFIWPFDEVLEYFIDIIINFIFNILKICISSISIPIYSAKIQLPEKNTVLNFKNISFSKYDRKVSEPFFEPLHSLGEIDKTDRNTFLTISCLIEPE